MEIYDLRISDAISATLVVEIYDLHQGDLAICTRIAPRSPMIDHILAVDQTI